jgi:transposase-like protein
LSVIAHNLKKVIIFDKKTMNLFSFTANFGSEESCRLHFKEERDKIGVQCKCGSKEHFWIKSVWSYECKKCRSRISLRSGTIMQSSNLSFLIWYKTMFLMTATKKGFSSKEIQKQLGLKRYEPVWAMVHKLRKAMGNRDARYTLEGMIEFDEGYFTVESSEIEKEKGIRGRGAVGKMNTAIMAESTILEDIETGKKSNQCRYFKAKVLTDHTSEQINETIKESISEKSILFSDKSTSYIDIADFVEIHITGKSNKETTTETLKWVHIAISNAKRNFLGNYHKIKGKYLQLYLNEFVYKLNRRYFEEKLFDRLVIAGITGL